MLDVNGKFKPYTEVTNFTINDNEMILEWNNKRVIFEFYDVKNNKIEKFKDKELSEKIDLNFSSLKQKNKGSYYFTHNITKDKTKQPDKFGYNITTINTDCYIQGNSLVCDEQKIDFTQAIEEQNLTLNLNKNYIEISGSDLSYIDPTIKYNYSSTYQGINTFAYAGNDSIDPINPPLKETQDLTDFTANAGLDKDDTTYATQSIGSGTEKVAFYFDFNHSNILSEDILSINGTFIGYNSFVSTQNFYLFVRNYTDNTYLQVDTKTVGGFQQKLYNYTTNSFYQNFSNNSNIEFAFTFDKYTMSVDYASLSLTYNGLAINSPTSNQEILNTLSTTLNTSQAVYNSSIWYTWNNGIKNNTLCTNSLECQSTITFPRQGYYNLSVYANKSDGTQTSKSVSNLFVGNKTLSTSLEDIDYYAWVAQQDYDYGIQFKWDISFLNNNSIINYANMTLYTGTYSGLSDFDVRIWRIDDQNWTESSTAGTINSQTKVNSTDGLFTSKSINSYTSVNITTQVIAGLGKSNLTVRLEDIDYLVSTIDSVFDSTTSLDFSAMYEFYDGFISFRPREYSTISERPTLNVTYYSQNSPPSLTNTLSNNSNFSTSTINFTFNISDDNDYIQNISIFIDNILNKTAYQNYWINTSINNSLNFSITNIPDGNHQWYIQAFDSDNSQTNSSTFNFTIDTIKPFINILYPSNNTNYSNTNLNINFTATDLHLSSCWWSNNSGGINYSLSNCQTNITTQIWKQGSSTIIVYVNDTFGNTNSSSVTFFIDNIAPTLTITHPSIGSDSFSTGTITLNYTVGDSGVGLSSCWYRNDTDANNITITCGVNTTISQPEDGSYIVYMWANDTLNNIASASKSWTVSATSPIVNILNPLNNKWFNNTLNIFFNFTSSDSNGIDTCELWGNWSGSWHKNQTKLFAGDLSVDISEGFFISNISDGFYKWNVKCNDTATPNNSSYATDNSTLGIDTIYPQINISHPKNQTYTINSLSINFTATDLNRDSCWYNINSTTNITLTSCLNSSFTANQGSSTLNLFINDSANNLNSSSVTFFVDSINPSISLSTSFSNGSYLNYNSSIVINLTISDVNLQACWYNDNSGTNTSFTCGSNLSLSTSERLHTIYLFANDTLNNINDSELISFTSDVTYPLINNLTITPTSGTQNFIFSFNSSDTNLNTSCFFTLRDSTGSVDSNIQENSSITCGNSNITTSTSKTASSFGTYNLTLYSRDLSGNENSSTKSFSLAAATTQTALGGGGGGGIVVGDNKTAWELTTEEGKNLYILKMIAGSSRTKIISLKNLGETNRTITLSCSGDLCEYVVFNNISIFLPVKKTITTNTEFTINLPSNITSGKYLINIFATDDLNRKGVVSIDLDVGVLGIVTTSFDKITSSKIVYGIKIPYILIIFLVWILSFFSLFIFVRKTTWGLSASIISGMFIGLSSLFFI